jgi:hypothetical protein
VTDCPAPAGRPRFDIGEGYTHRVGISNSRLVAVSDEAVTLRTTNGKAVTVTPVVVRDHEPEVKRSRSAELSGRHGR